MRPRRAKNPSNARHDRRKERASRHCRDSRVQWDTRTASFVTPRRGRRSLLERAHGAGISLLVSGVGLLTLLGAAVRFTLLEHPMRYDESYNYLHFVARGPIHVVTHYAPNNHVAHTLLVSLASSILGAAPAALRTPAFVAGVLLIPATAWLAWTVSRGVAVSILAALTVCCSSALIEYSANARGYAQLSLLTVLSMIALQSAIRTPADRWRWLAWGACGAIGMWTVPVMLLPFLGMSAFTFTWAIRNAADPTLRRGMLRGLAGGSALCAVLTGLLHLPILVRGGATVLADSGRFAYDVLGRQIESPGAMLAETAKLWTRHLPTAGIILLSVGFFAFLARSVRARLYERWLLLAAPALALAIALAIRAPLPPRTWLFALPLLIVCAVHGACELVADQTGAIVRRAIATMMMLALLAVPSMSLVNAWWAPILCSEPRGLVEVEHAIEECRAFGPDRCAVVSGYSPATAYYLARKRMPPLPPPSSPTVRRVFIITDDNRNLSELWNEGVDGFAAFDRPRTWKRQATGTAYLAERADRSALR